MGRTGEREREGKTLGDSWNSLGMTYSKVDLGQLERFEQFEVTEAGPGAVTRLWVGQNWVSKGCWMPEASPPVLPEWGHFLPAHSSPLNVQTI